MKRWLIGSGILFVLAILGITVSIFPQRGGTATGAPQAGPNQDVTIINDVPLIPFESVPNFFKLSPDMNFGETLSVAVNSKGNIVVLNHEGTATSGPLYGNATTQVWEFDSNGKFLREIGKGVYGLGYSHSVRFDRYDNLWIVDKGTNSIMKFNPAGYVLMNLGRRPEGYEGFEFKRSAPAEKRAVDGLYDGPTDVAWDAEDNIYVSDGYVNSRIAKMNKNGDWIKSWGSYGTGPSQFRNPHNMQIDRQGNIYVLTAVTGAFRFSIPTAISRNSSGSTSVTIRSGIRHSVIRIRTRRMRRHRGRSASARMARLSICSLSTMNPAVSTSSR